MKAIKQLEALCRAVPSNCAVTARQVAQRLFDSEDPSATMMRKTFRLLDAAAKDGLVEKIRIPGAAGQDTKAPRYLYRLNPAGSCLNAIVPPYMALQLVLAAEVLVQSIAEIPQLEAYQRDTECLARARLSGKAERVADVIRVLVNDPLGRPPVKVAPTVLESVYDGLVNAKQVTLTFLDGTGAANGERKGDSAGGAAGAVVAEVVTPRGLVFDPANGCALLVATRGVLCAGVGFHLQRVSAVTVEAQAADPWPFDLDGWISRHVRHSPARPPSSTLWPMWKPDGCREGLMEVRLRVAPEAVAALRERPLGFAQVIALSKAGAGGDPRSWPTLTAQVAPGPNLVNFLFGLGRSVTVESPQRLREEICAAAADLVRQHAAPPEAQEEAVEEPPRNAWNHTLPEYRRVPASLQ